MDKRILVIHPRDNVAVALQDLAQGSRVTTVDQTDLVAVEDIPASHKIALRDIADGEEIIKYGEVVAVSTQPIGQGAWVHSHNLESQRWHA